MSSRKPGKTHTRLSTSSLRTSWTASSMVLLLWMSACASAPLPSVSASPASQPASQAVLTPSWHWDDPPKFPRCPPNGPAGARYCLSIEDAKQFLHWQQDQKSRFDDAMVDADKRGDKELARRGAVVEDEKSKTLGWVLIVIGSVVAAGAAAFGAGYGVAKIKPLAVP